MGNLFGKKDKPSPKKNQITEQDKAVLQLKQQRDKIKQFQKRINLQLEKERSIARELLKNNQKQRALLILKRKKRLETSLERAEGQLENLEQMVQDIEFAQIQVEVVSKLEEGNKALKEIHALMSIDQIETILEETREGVEKQREIDELLMGQFTEADEADLLGELEAMVQEEEPKVSLPEVPDDEIAATEGPEPAEKEATPKKQKAKQEALLAS